MLQKYITLNELKQKQENKKQDIYVWGFSQKSTILQNIELVIGNDIVGYIDNNINKWGVKINGHTIYSPIELQNKNSYLIIANDRFEDQLQQQFEELNISSFYFLKIDFQSFYTVNEIQRDIEFVEKLKVHENDLNKHKKILVECLDGLGDTILKLPFLVKLEQSNKFEECYFIFRTEQNKEICQTFLKNTYYIDRDNMKKDEKYRHGVYEWIVMQAFHTAINFSIDQRHFFENQFINNDVINIPNEIFFYKYIENRFNKIKDKKNDFKYICYDEAIINLANDVIGLSNIEYGIGNKLSLYINNEKESNKEPPKYVALGLCGKGWGHSFPKDKTIEIIKWINKKGYSTVMLGGVENQKFYDDLLENENISSNDNVNYAGKLSVFQSMEFIKKSKLFWGQESALAHVAYGFGVPGVVMIANSSIPQQIYRHKSEKLIYITSLEKCGPCLTCKYKNQENGIECIKNIKVETVIENLEKIIN